MGEEVEREDKREGEVEEREGEGGIEERWEEGGEGGGGRCVTRRESGLVTTGHNGLHQVRQYAPPHIHYYKPLSPEVPRCGMWDMGMRPPLKEDC